MLTKCTLPLHLKECFSAQARPGPKSTAELLSNMCILCNDATTLQPSGMAAKDYRCRWFHFRLTGVQDQALVVNLVNAGQSSFPEAWPGYKACASYDLKDWFRVQTAWDEKAGVITMQHKSNHVRQNAVCQHSLLT